MIKHLFKLMWNRKKKNFLMMLEIFISFVVLFIALSVLIYNLNNYFSPLGFSYKNVWLISMNSKEQDKEKNLESLKQIDNKLSSYSEIEYHAFSKSLIFMPYTMSNSSFEYNGKSVTLEILNGDDDFVNVLDVKVLEGRWFDNRDDAYNKIPVVINKKAEKLLFGEEKGLGKSFFDDDDEKKSEYEVVGIIKDFRYTGQFSKSRNILIKRINLNDEINKIDYINDFMMNRILLKMKPSADANFEEVMMKELATTAKNINFKVQRADNARKFANKTMMILPVILLIITSFLVINVALGLFGIIWYTINKRKSEIGLRRAVGSTANRIYSQILGESLVLTTFGIFLGIIVAIQFPLLNFISFIDTQIYYLAILVSIFIIYMLTIFCAIYPSKIAASIEPAIALHYE